MSSQYWVARESTAKLIRKTLPVTYNQSSELVGLVTLSLAIPLASWMQLIATRRIVFRMTPSGSSLRHHLSCGYHHPDVLAEERLCQMHKAEHLDTVHGDWDRLHNLIAYYIDSLSETYRVDPELIAFMLPNTRLVRGMATGTLDAWRSLDAAQLLDGETIARVIAGAIDNAEWVRSDIHVPIEPSGEETDETRKQLLKKQLAYIQKHGAFWKLCPQLSPFTVSPNDVAIKVERSQQFWKNHFMAWEPAKT